VLEVLVIQVKPTVDRRGRRDSVPQLPEGHRGTEVMTVRLDFEDEKLSTQECARTVAGLEAAVRARLKIDTFRLHVMDEEEEWEVLQSAAQLEHRHGVVDVLVEQTKPTIDRRGRRESLPAVLE
jgi:hypothetical protein